MPRRITLLVFSLFSSLSFAATSTDPESKMVLESLAKRYAALGSWEANFTQSEKSPGFAQEIISEGYFKFVLKNKFLLQSQGGALAKKLVSNGTAAAYIEDRGKGTPKERYFVRRFANAKSLELERYLVFFSGLKKKSTSKDFIVKGVFKKPDLEVTLTPTKESDYSEIIITFHNSEEFPKQLVFKDPLGGQTTLKILEAKKISKTDPKWFDLSLPTGAKVEESP